MQIKRNELSVRELVLTAMMDALLIALQMATGFLAGIELVTTVYVCYFHVFGRKLSLILGIIFSLTRCLIFGFYPSVVVLYLLYYFLFPMLLGRIQRRQLLWIGWAGLGIITAMFILNPGDLIQTLWTMLLALALAYGLWELYHSKKEEPVVLAFETFLGAFCFYLTDLVVSSVFFALSSEAIGAYALAGIPVFLLQGLSGVFGCLILAKPVCNMMKQGYRTILK